MAGVAYPRLTTSTASQFQSPPPRYGDLPPVAGVKANHDETVQLRCGQGRKIRSEGLLRYKDRIMDGTSSRMMSHGVFFWLRSYPSQSGTVQKGCTDDFLASGDQRWHGELG